MSGIIIAAVVVSCTGLLLGLFLGVMGKKFYVEVDQKEIDVRAELPGNNCGGCGYAGCDALAKAIAAGEAPANACPVGGAPVAAKIGAIMGEEVGESVRMTAFVKCAGDCDKAKENYVYSGAMDCTTSFLTAVLRHVHTDVWDMVRVLRHVLLMQFILLMVLL